MIEVASNLVDGFKLFIERKEEECLIIKATESVALEIRRLCEQAADAIVYAKLRGILERSVTPYDALIRDMCIDLGNDVRGLGGGDVIRSEFGRWVMTQAASSVCGRVLFEVKIPENWGIDDADVVRWANQSGIRCERHFDR